MEDDVILAIARRTQHSDKHQSNDAIMFGMTCDQLRERGYHVELIDEDRLASFLADHRPTRIISMAQRPENTALLARIESDGGVIVNSFESILNTYRVFLALRLAEEPAFAGTYILSSLVEEDLEDFEGEAYAMIGKTLGESFWLKRGDVHAAHPDDVTFVASGGEFEAALENFRSRDVTSAVVQEHIEGEVVKFYAVSDRRFFHAQYFESEEPVGFDTTELQSEADRIARMLGLSIYGGDAVIGADGRITFIDFNAWPSFGTVRDRAVPQIVEAIIGSFAPHHEGGESRQTDIRTAEEVGGKNEA